MAKANAPTEGVKSAADIDAILNRHRLNLAKNRKLVEGWLPLSKQEREQQESNTEPEAASVDTLLRPELAGLGADLTQGSRLGANGLPSGGGGELEKLRKQMLGKNASIKISKSPSDGIRMNRSTGRPVADKLSADSQKHIRADELDALDSEDESRAASFKSKRSKKEKSRHGGETPQLDPEHVIVDESPLEKRMMEGETLDAKQVAPDQVRESPEATDNETYNKPKHAVSIMDEVIAERRRKKKRKKRKKLKAEGHEAEAS